MRRSDRLFQLITHLSDHALHRAEDLAARTDVSLRTLYRDIGRLQTAGMPVTGTRGQGYRLAPALTLPPLTLTEDEVETLQLGLAIVLQSPDDDLRAHATTLAAKIDAALPETTVPDPAMWDTVHNPFSDAARGLAQLPTLRAAIKARQKMHIIYNSADGSVTQAKLRPNALTHHARSWLLSATHDTTHKQATYRVDLIESATALPELY